MNKLYLSGVNLEKRTEKMFETITKKEFIEKLAIKNSVLLGSFLNLKQEKAVKIMNTAYNYSRNIESIDPAYIRKCVRKQSNALQFSNGSWLYFNDIKNSKLLKHGNIILSYKERYDNFDKVFVHDIIIYLIG